jgi:uncharacterized membrane protein HdeD (DUF308 family)
MAHILPIYKSLNLFNMKTIGIILIIGGIIMLIFRGFNIQTEEKILDAEPIKINKTENKWIGWPVYAGAVAIIAGIILMATDKKKQTV